jgi:hypothetical protein
MKRLPKDQFDSLKYHALRELIGGGTHNPNFWRRQQPPTLSQHHKKAILLVQ